MAAKRRNKVLGIALGERSALVAEVAPAAAGGKPLLRKAAEFPFPGGVGLAQPGALGAALAGFLQAQGFSARAAVVGVPARWLLTKKKEVPPVDLATATGILRLQAETDFTAEAEELVCDYAGQTSPSEPRGVLLLALPRRYVTQVSELAAAARIQAVALTPYAATLGASLAGTNGDVRVVLLGPGGAEFVARRGDQPRVMRYLGAADAPAAALAGELRRAALGLPAGAGADELWVWDDAGAGAGAVAALGEALRAPVRAGDLPSLGVQSLNGTAAGGGRGYAAAVSLALAGLETAAPPTDFLHSRLAAPAVARLPRRTVLLGVAGLALVLLVALVASDLRRRQSEVAALRRQVTDRADAVKSASGYITRVSYAKTWRGGKPRFLACLREVTAAVPEDGQTYLTSFNLHDNMKGGFTGKSASGNDVLSLRDRLRAGGRFRDVKMSFDAPRTGGKQAGATPGGPTPAGPPPGAVPPPGMPPGGAVPGVPAQPVPGMPPGAQPVPGAPQPAAPSVAAGPPPGMEPMAMALPPGAAGMPPGVVVLPPGAVPPGPGPGGPPPAPAGPVAAGPGPGGPAGVGPGAPGGAPGGGEVSFTVTFQYVPPD